MNNSQTIEEMLEQFGYHYYQTIKHASNMKDADKAKSHIRQSAKAIESLIKERERLARIDELRNLPTQAGWTFHGVKADYIRKRVDELEQEASGEAEKV